MLAIFVPILRFSKVFASGETLTGATAVNAIAGEENSITDLQVNGSGNDNLNIRLYIPEGNGNLKMTSITGLTFFNDVDEGNLLQFRCNRNDINIALATLKFTGNKLGNIKVEMSLTGPGQFYNPTNGHLYEVVYADASEDNEINWNNAKTAAEAKTAFGASGYLGTITSAEENSFVTERMSNGGWFGASDSETEGDWKWVTGPETGTSFWSGNGSGHAVSGRYSNWNDSEPNDYDNGDPGEDCAQVLSGENGLWNDLPCDGTQSSYLVEYGTDGNLPNVPYLEKTIHVNAKQINLSSCTEFEALDDDSAGIYADISLSSDIDCHGATVTSLFPDDAFQGTFEGNGHTIKNIVIDSEDSTHIGLIASSEDADFRNIKLDNISVSGDSYVGVLLGSAGGGNFENIHAKNITINAKSSCVGGLIGIYQKDYEKTSSTSLQNLSVDGSIESDSGAFIGGLIGYIDLDSNGTTTTINKVYANTDIIAGPTEGDSVGGLIGYIEGYTEGDVTILNISNTYAWGNISSMVYKNGGLIGTIQIWNSGGDGDGFNLSIDKSYADVKIATNGNYSGGLVGYLSNIYSLDSVSVNNSFAMGEIDSNNKGGLIGYINSTDNMTFTNNYFDESKTTANSCDSNENISSGCVAVNTNDSQSNYFINNNVNMPLDTWDFDNVWVKQASTGPVFGWNDTGDDSGGLSSDNDGVSDTVENSAPNSGDANNDGIQDSRQANVASYVNSVTGQYSVLQAPSSCSISSVSSQSEDSNTVKDSAYTYPAGLMSFTIDCGTSGFSADIVQYHYGVTGNFVLRKHNPNTNAYFNIAGATITNQTISTKPVLKTTYQVTDGSNLDIDGIQNGIIVDPVGLASQTVGVPNTGL